MTTEQSPDPRKEKQWSEEKEHVLAVGDTIFLNDGLIQAIRRKGQGDAP